MKSVKSYLKKKVFLKLIGFISVPVCIFLLIVVVVINFIGIVMIGSETTSDKDYITALENKKSEIEDNSKINVNMNIYFSLDEVTRAKPYNADKIIYVQEKDLTCFIKNDEQIAEKDKQVAYDCLDYDKQQIKEFEYYYKLFNETTDYSETEIVSTSGDFGFPVNEPYVKTAGFNSSDSVHNGHHDGVDFVPLNNESVLSSTSGEVIEAKNTCDKYGGYLGNSCGGGFGNHIVIACKVGNKKYHITYGHMANIKVNQGDTVKQGQNIGTVGNSGNTTGKHLHFQIDIETNGGYQAINPETLIKQTNLSGDKQEILKRAGVNSKDYNSVDFIISHESSWNEKAVNESSGAYGLCQALPATKLSSTGDDWKTNPVTQMKWCDNYAKERYGSWQKAESFWRENEWW